MAGGGFGKKAKQRRRKDAKRKRQERIVLGAGGAVRFAVRGPRLCLPMCFLLQRVLAQQLPDRPFMLRLGSLHVLPEDDRASPILFDPRSPGGIDDGFHAWLEDRHDTVLDPSIHPTLSGEVYPLHPDDYFYDSPRQFTFEGMRFVYEVLPELQITGVEESERHLAALMKWAMAGVVPEPGTIYLDVRWRVR
mgnify:CR=1 FL=1